MKLKKGFLKFDARSRLLLTVMIFLLLLTFYYRKAYAPRAKALKETRERYVSLQQEYLRLEKEIPLIEAERIKLDSLKDEYERLFARVMEEEKNLPKNINIPDILKFLVKNKDKFNLQIVNIASRKDKATALPLYTPPAETKQKSISYYSVLPIEMEFYASFDDLIRFISYIEEKLPYQRVGGLQINMQKTQEGQPQVFLTVISIMGIAEQGEEEYDEFRAAIDKVDRINASLDPFHAKERPRQQERLAGFTLSGIIRKKGEPYAIINGSTYKIGEKVQGKKIINISKDTVLLEEEDKVYLLEMGGS